MTSYILVCHIMRIIQFINATMLASEVADVRDEQYCLQWGLSAENPGSEEPPAEIYQLLHNQLL